MSKTQIKRPEEARRELAANLEPRCEELRRLVNRALSNNEDGHSRHVVAVDNFPRGVIAIVVAEIEAAGWTTKEESGGDCRDSYHNLTITEKPQYCGYER